MNKILKVFFKEDCRSCKLVKLKLDMVAREKLYPIDVVYFDTNEDKKEAETHNVTSVPTLILIDRDTGATMWRHVGHLIYHDLRENMEK